MARDHARLLTTIWQNPDFVALDGEAQRVFMLLLSQPRLSLCGVIDLTPGRWARLAADTTTADMEAAIDRLCDAGFVVVDVEAEELLVRSFVKHDGVLSSPNLIQAMWKAWTGVHSITLRSVIARSLPDKAYTPGFGTSKKDYEAPRQALELRADQGSPNPSPNPSARASMNGSSTPTPSPTPSPEAEHPSVPPERPPGLALVPATPSPPATDDASAIFVAWVNSVGRTNRSVLTPERRRLILKQLRHYPVEDLLDAVRGWRHSAHHRGENDRNTVYNDLELLLRDAKRIEMFRDLERDPPQRPLPKGMKGIEAWLQRTGTDR